MSARPLALDAWIVVAFAVAASACQSVAQINVSYTDASAGPDATSDGGARGDGAGPSEQPDAAPGPHPSDAGDEATPETPTACPCDQTAGLGCCIPTGAGAPFCTSNGSACTQAGGLFAFCSAYDANTDSQCCWNAGGGGSTSYAGTCGQRKTACLATTDCAAQPCAVVSCKGQMLGACGADAPVCPP